MSAVFGRQRRLLFCVCWTIAALAVPGAMPAFAETVTVTVDEARVIKLPERVATIVIGNPLIADANLQAGGVLVVTGKGFGSTNMVGLDRGGKVVMDKTLQVVGSAGSDLVVVYKGVERESYSCNPDCEKRLTLGDSATYFNSVLQQSGTRNTSAQQGPASR